MDKPSLLKPTLIGGAVFGFLGALPCVGAINLACCALVMGGGFLAAYLYSSDCKKLGTEFRTGEGAKIGVVAGIFYWLVSSVVSGILQMFMPQPDFGEILDQMEQGGMPPEMLDAMEQFFDLLGGPMGVVIMLGVGLVLGLIFSTIGGLIGGAVFKVAAAPPAPPATGTAPPPPPPPVAPGS